jgi:hypothetical protein
VYFSELAQGMQGAAQEGTANLHPAFVGSIASALWYNIIVLAGVAACAFLLAKPNLAHHPVARPAPAD